MAPNKIITKEFSQYFIEGLKAFYQRKKNPYQMGTWMHNDWNQGFNYEMNLNANAAFLVWPD